ncbi:MAG: HRDC domain-containing protein [Halobacteriales archaeon]|nr:HRDC domain-containing protein [Halobacteriales archaeon]
MAQAKSGWCVKCHQPSAGEVHTCGEATVQLLVHPDAERSAQRLFELLKAWQRAQGRVQGTEPFMVIPNKALACLAAVQPETTHDLIAVPGIGPKKARDYGPVLLKWFRALHAGQEEKLLLARAPMPEGMGEAEQALVLELREAAQPLSAMAAQRGLALEAWLAQVAGLVEKGAVDLPHIYCSPAEVAWLMPLVDAGEHDAHALGARVPESGMAARFLLPALARYRAKPAEEPAPRRR